MSRRGLQVFFETTAAHRPVASIEPRFDDNRPDQSAFIDGKGITWDSPRLPRPLEKAKIHVARTGCPVFQYWADA